MRDLLGRSWTTGLFVMSLLLSACGQQAVAPPTPSPTPGLPVTISPSEARFSVVGAQTGSTVLLRVEVINTDRVNGYGSLRVALALKGTGLADLARGISVASSPDPRCLLPFRTPLPMAEPSDYPGSWAVEYDVEPAGGPLLMVGPGGTLASTCVFVSVEQPSVSGAALEGAFFVYQDDGPTNGRFDVPERIRSRPLGQPMQVTIGVVEARP